MDSNTDQISTNDRLFRRLIRKASVIIPATGESVPRGTINSRAWTLRSSGVSIQSDVNERTPLLPSNISIASNYTATAITKKYRLKSWARRIWRVVSSDTARMAIKCSLAYWIGSLGTFITPVSRFIGPKQGKHMVATVTVYFHPARTRGSMYEASMFALIALVYSTLLSITSMITAALLEDQGLLVLAHVIILVLFCAGGLGMVGWIKQVMSNPSVNTACSLASISIINVLTKENDVQFGTFTWDRIRQNTITVFMGIMITSLVSFTVWPSSAINEMKGILVKSTDSFSELLTLITAAFLEGSEEFLETSTFKRALADQRLVFTDLPKRLKEAKYERYLSGTEAQYIEEARLSECMKNLAQQLGGLQSAASTQFTLLKQTTKKAGGLGVAFPHNEIDATPMLYSPYEADSESFWGRGQLPAAPAVNNLGVIDEAEDSEGPGEQETLTPERAFTTFLMHLGPPMKSLAYTLKLILDDLPFIEHAPSKFTIDINPQYHESLQLALNMFTEARKEAVNDLYHTPEMNTQRSVADAADVEEVLAACNYFANCLEDFAEEIGQFLQILEKLKQVQDEKVRSWNWLKFWRRKKRGPTVAEGTGAVAQILKFEGNSKLVQNVERDKPLPRTYKIWKALRLFRRNDVKFGIKTGVGAAVFAMFAFFPDTRPFFSHWHGEWGLVSYMVVMSLTVGQSSTTAWNRLLGTVAGAIYAVLVWTLFSDNPTALSICGFLFSLPCFVIILTWKQQSIGRFILLTYNITCLYAYSLSINEKPDDDDEIIGLDPIIASIAWHRTIAVAAGVIWAIFVNLYIWPLSARKKLREGLSLFWLRLALIWSRDPVDYLIHIGSEKPQLNSENEHALQMALLKITSYSDQAPTEFRLKGHFPTADYKAITMACQNIVDACHGLAYLINRHQREGVSRRLTEVLQVTKRERRDLASRISHLFYVLAGAIRIGIPLPEALPETGTVRDRLMAKVGNFRKEKLDENSGETDQELELIFTYFLVTGKITEALEECIRRVRKLYGILEDEMLEF